MMNRNKQNGMTALGWLMVLFLIGFSAIVVLKILPIVLESYKVKSALESLKKDPDASNMSKKELLDALHKRFEVDDVTAVTDDDITFDTNPGVITIRIDYENRKPLLGNFDIVGKYHEKAEVVHR